MESITIKDIARICGVGVSTVSRAMNNHPDINQETKDKVMDAIQKYHYVPNNSARNLKLNDARTVAVLVKGTSNPLFGGMLSTIEDVLHKEKYTMVLQHVKEEQDEIDVAIQLEKEKRLRGIIFLGGAATVSPKLKQISVPFVMSTISLPADEVVSNFGCISVDDVEESCKMVEYLIRHGHTKIAMLGSYKKDRSIGALRLRGYQKAFEKNGIAYDADMITYMQEDMSYNMETGYRMMTELLGSNKEFTAVFAIADVLAIGACKAILDHGKKVPEDYSVVGFDGLDFTRYYNPSITTLRQPMEQMAEATIKMLLDMIRKKGKPGKILFSGDLIERESVQSI